MEIQQLYIYPVKSLLPIEVSEATITRCGFQYDREYALFHFEDAAADGPTVVTIKTASELCLFQQELDEAKENVIIRHTLHPTESLTLPLTPSVASLARAKSHAVTIFGTSTTGLDVGDTAAAFFAAHLSFPSVRLFFIGQPRDPHPMLTPTVSGDDGQVSHPQKIRFMDVGPMLLTTSASANDAASRLPDDAAPFDVSKFRPNIHISTPPDVAAYDEEFWREIVIGEGLRLACTFNAARCLSINVDYGSGTQARKEEQLYRLMTKDRRINPIYQYKPCFGRYCFCTEDDAVVRVGDRVKVVERNEKRHVEVS